MQEVNKSFYPSLDFSNGNESDGPSNWTNDNYNRDLETRMEIQDFFDSFTRVFLSIQIAIGFPGNIISIIVWSKGKECSNIACSTYFKLLAFADLLSLTACGYAVTMISGVHLVHHVALCIGPNFLINFAPQLSTWLVVFISVERLLCVTFPFVFSPSGSRTRAKIVFSVLILILTGINSHCFLFELRETSSSKYCYINAGNRHWYYLLYRISSVWTLCIVPFFLIVTGNILILVQLWLRKLSSIARNQRNSNIAMFTRLCITSGVLQAVSIFPSMLITLKDLESEGQIEYQTLEERAILYFLSRNTLFLNNCLNCLVYCLSASKFRSDIKHMFYCHVNERRGSDQGMATRQTNPVSNEIVTRI